MLDLIIVGLGPAGISAAIYAKRSGLNVLCFEFNTPGGLVNTTSKVENYPGFDTVTGPVLSEAMFKHFNNQKVPYKFEEVLDIKVDNDKKIVTTNKGIYESKAVIIASGREHKSLDLPNEQELVGNGISYCAICDGPLFKDKVVAIYGAGNSAYEEGLYLTNICKKVYMICRSSKIAASASLREAVLAKDNVEVIYNATIKELVSEDSNLKGVKFTDDNVILIDGLFVYVGYQPKNNMFINLGITNDKGYIEVDSNYETKIKGIFAVGDIIKKDVYQIITASSDGAVAAIKATEYIKN